MIYPPKTYFITAMGAMAQGLFASLLIGTSIGESSVTAGPAGAFIAVLIACELGKLESGSTKVDIILTPTVTILSGFAVAKPVCPDPPPKPYTNY